MIENDIVPLPIGLLIEPNRNTFGKLLKKNRKAIHINSCVSTSRQPQKVKFLNPHMDQLGGVIGNSIQIFYIKNIKLLISEKVIQ